MGPGWIGKKASGKHNEADSSSASKHTKPKVDVGCRSHGTDSASGLVLIRY
ncbi:hypothetical protein P7K49_007281 [Saguinus oedipus]|uniref:Uncharacterized protein n=1 Tax=Saguinus oedipus TaxID=9490 RepID=A0ABQ9VUG9_SAGOE|nr:hypothetical protein P7K49_007281 [Saguinus oedipus]